VKAPSTILMMTAHFTGALLVEAHHAGHAFVQLDRGQRVTHVGAVERVGAADRGEEELKAS
jgi:hypothetical protein